MSFREQDEINGVGKNQSLTPRLAPTNIPVIHPNATFVMSQKGTTREEKLSLRISGFDEKIKAFHAYYYDLKRKLREQLLALDENAPYSREMVDQWLNQKEKQKRRRLKEKKQGLQEQLNEIRDEEDSDERQTSPSKSPAKNQNTFGDAMAEGERFAKGNVKNAAGDYGNTAKANVSEAASGQSPFQLRPHTHISLPGAHLGAGGMENAQEPTHTLS